MELETSQDDLFSPEESERRMSEAMRRMCRQPATMNMTTGQNLKEPLLSEAELHAAGISANAALSDPIPGDGQGSGNP